MEGFLGTQAPFPSDVSLMLTVVLGVAAVAGVINGHRRRISKHCPVMATGALLNWLPVLVVMVPKWVGVVTGAAEVRSGLPRVLVLGHGALGAVGQLLMTYTVVRMYWMEHLPPEEPVWLMRATMAFWMLAALGGVFAYGSLYT